MGDGGWQEFVGQRWYDWDGFGLDFMWIYYRLDLVWMWSVLGLDLIWIWFGFGLNFARIMGWFASGVGLRLICVQKC